MKLIKVAREIVDRLQKSSTADPSETAAQELRAIAAIATPEYFKETLYNCAREPGSIAGIANPRFGEPSVLLAESKGWVFELIYWYDMVSAIHEHSYPGAFLAASGRRLHLEFDYTTQSTVDSSSRCDFGLLTSCRAELLDEGDIRLIRPFEDFIHAVWPADTPCLTAVIRKKAPRLSRSYLPNASGAAVRFDERVAEAEVLARIRFLHSIERWSGRREMLRCVGTLSEAMSASGLVYLLMTLEVRPQELTEGKIGATLVSRFGPMFYDSVIGCLRTDTAFRHLYSLRIQASEVRERLALGLGFFGPLVERKHLVQLTISTSDLLK